MSNTPYVTNVTGTQSGNILATLTEMEAPTEQRWATRANGIDTGQHTFQLGDSEFTHADWDELIYPWRNTLDIDYGNGIVYSGLIMGEHWDEDTQTMTVATAEIRSILARRKLYGIGTYAGGTRILNGRSLRGLIYQILYYATQGGLSTVWDLPFHFPAFDEAGAENRTYWNYLFQDAEELVTEAQNAEGGPNVHFQPRRVNGHREYLVRVGDPHLGGPEFEFEANVDEPTAWKVERDTEGAEMVTGVFATGSGSGPDIRHGEGATVAVPGGTPTLDITNSDWNDIEDEVQLASHARSIRDAFSEPTRQIKFKTLAEHFLPDGLPGSPIDLWVPGSKRLPPRSELYCIGTSGDLTPEITVHTQKRAA